MHLSFTQPADEGEGEKRDNLAGKRKKMMSGQLHLLQ
jgi:hypothetical protein